MLSDDLAADIRNYFPDTEDVIVQYLSGFLVDDAGEEEDVLQIANDILRSLAGDKLEALEKLMLSLNDRLKDQLSARVKHKMGPKLLKLDKVVDMSKTQMSNTIALSEGVDLESINKGKWVVWHSACIHLSHDLSERRGLTWKNLRNKKRSWRSVTCQFWAELAYFRLPKAKIEKRARRDLYEGSKLLDAYKKQVLFLSDLLFWS